jgi:hypothetical protein
MKTAKAPSARHAPSSDSTSSVITCSVTVPSSCARRSFLDSRNAARTAFLLPAIIGCRGWEQKSKLLRRRRRSGGLQRRDIQALGGWWQLRTFEQKNWERFLRKIFFDFAKRVGRQIETPCSLRFRRLAEGCRGWLAGSYFNGRSKLSLRVQAFSKRSNMAQLFCDRRRIVLLLALIHAVCFVFVDIFPLFSF